MNLRFLAVGALGFGAVCWAFLSTGSHETIFEPVTRQIEAGAPCPWRDAERDLTNWFPAATGYERRNLILSGQRLALQARLGRPLLPDEMALHYYAVHRGAETLGSVVPRRLKGPHGAIELVLALDARQQISHVKIQALREPLDVARAFENMHLEERLTSIGASSNLCLDGETTPAPVSELARQLAAAVKTTLALWEAGGHDAHHH